MAANPRVLKETAVINWDGAQHRLVKGQIIDVPPGSPLEDAIGAGRLEPVYHPGNTAIAPQAEEEAGEQAAETPAPAPRKKTTTTTTTDKEGS